MENAATDPSPLVCWIGTYPAKGPGTPADEGEGVWRLELDRRSGAVRGGLAVRTAAPSFLAWSVDGRTLFAAGETADGTVSAFRREGDALVPAGTVSSGGDEPCHLLAHPDGSALYVSNYGSGTLGVLTLGADGLSAEVVAAAGPVQVFTGSGSGPRTDRQEGPHAHSALLAPGGRHLLVADLGSDELRRFRLLADGRLEADGVAHTFAPGTGPRHLAAGPGGHLYVVGELSATVHVLAWDTAAGTATQLQQVPACASPLVSGEHVYPAHLVVVPDAEGGPRLLVSVRGADVLSRLAVLDDGARLEHEGDVPVGGAWPRHFAVDRADDGSGASAAWVVTALQGSDAVVAARLTAEGVTAPVARLAVPVPSVVVPDPAP